MIEMLSRYWLEVCVVSADKTILAATAKSSFPSSAMFLVQETRTAWHQLYSCYLLTYYTSSQHNTQAICLVSMYLTQAQVIWSSQDLKIETDLHLPD